MRRLARVGMLFLLAASSIGATGGSAEAQAVSEEARAVRRAVEQFLDDLGSRRLDQLPPLFAPRATMVVARQREGQWSITHQTSEEWLAGLRAQTPGTIFTEPLTNVTVHVESGTLAFLRADFTVVVDGQVRSHGVDFFTLVKDSGAWKIVNGSYTSIPGPG